MNYEDYVFINWCKSGQGDAIMTAFPAAIIIIETIEQYKTYLHKN